MVMAMVAIGSPSGLHADQAIAAARPGLHVMVEKPLDISTASRTRPCTTRRRPSA